MREYTNNNSKKVKNKGFTLIELLAVIVILALIALIALPIILNIIEKSRKSAFKDSVYGIMESVKVKYAEAMLDEVIEPTYFEYPFDTLEFNGTKPKGGMITIDKNGLIALALYNNKWCAIKQADENEVRVIAYDADTCKIDVPMITEGSSIENLDVGLDSAIPGSYFNIKNVTGSVTCFNLSDGETEITNTKELSDGEHEIECRMIDNGSVVTSLKRTFKIARREMTGSDIVENNSDMVFLDPNGNPRFVGSDPNNYVNFGNDLYRIIGVFDNQMKIIYWGTKENPGIFYSDAAIPFDPGASQGGHGEAGFNDWNQAELKVTLNTIYWNTIPTSYQAMVDQDHVWNIGGMTSTDTTSATRRRFYISERGGVISSSMTSATWKGNVGLMYPSDYGYATSSSNEVCDTVAMRYWTKANNMEAATDCAGIDYNWLANTSNMQWTLMPATDKESYVFYAASGGYVACFAFANANFFVVRPVLYLRTDVKVRGQGTKEEPFELSL